MTIASTPDDGQPCRLPAYRAAHPSSEIRLSAHVERLLLDVVTDGFTVHCCGPQAAPYALVASYQWKHNDYVDLVTIRRFDHITTARACTSPRTTSRTTIDIFAPETVVWSYEGPPQWALPALLELIHPRHPHAPTHAFPAPTSLHIPRNHQRPMTIRLPLPSRANIRAARLAAGITAPGQQVDHCMHQRIHKITTRHTIGSP
jgi:hypothetical protein